MVEAAGRLTQPRIYIIGVGDDGQEGLTSLARQRLEQADLVIGSRSTLTHLGLSAERAAVADDLDQLMARIQSYPDRRLVVLSSGDPLFFGVARYLCDRLGKDEFEVVPHVSSMQLAFARVKESWDDAFLANLATQSLPQILPKARLAEKVGLFTTEQITPRKVAEAFLNQRLDCFTAYVCENLGSPDERVTQAELVEIARQDFAPLNVMVLVRQPACAGPPGRIAGAAVDWESGRGVSAVGAQAGVTDTDGGPRDRAGGAGPGPWQRGVGRRCGQWGGGDRGRPHRP